MPDKRGKYLPGEGGRPKGVPNKLSGQAKEALKLAFDGRGGVPALVEWANQFPTEFYKLWSKLIPHEITGADGEAVTIRVVTGIEASPEAKYADHPAEGA